MLKNTDKKNSKYEQFLRCANPNITAPKTIFLFSMCSEGMVLPKIYLAYHIFCITGKDEISSLQKDGSCFWPNNEIIIIAIFPKSTLSYEIFSVIGKHNIYFFLRIWYYLLLRTTTFPTKSTLKDGISCIFC